ncbi:hypothetical protein AALP_AA8G163000 [Arabis alpina]|uniref:Uncharacterized protein n=1 Tax=Arabis alpina TaxID=50452 RepID=A0A087G7F0_ARAAL|nr:hypothetical protein AALP_AA8G163000 [Arabis alpina]
MDRTTTLWVWFLLMIFLVISISGSGEGQQHVMKKTRSSAVVVGTVYCDTCFNGAFSKSPNHLIPGALVAVECLDENSKPSFRQDVKTDEHGQFKAKLPFSVSKHVKKIKRCSVKLLSSSQPYCSIAASATSSSLKRLRSSNHGEKTQVFSAGFFTFKPQNQPEICSQKTINLHDTKPLLPDPTFPPPLQDQVPDPSPLPIPKLPIVPPVTDLPLPKLPPVTDLPVPPVTDLPVPPVTDLPVPPVTDLPLPKIPPVTDLPVPKIPPLVPPGAQESPSLHSKKDDSLEDKKTEVLKPNFFFLPPNPLMPPLIPNPLNPPSLIPPNPLIPSPPALPPLPFVPSPPTIPLPPLPLVPSPSPPTLPVPLPPLPLIPSPPTTPKLPVPLPPLPLVPTLPLPPLPPVPGITPPPSPPPPAFPIPLPIPPIIPGVPLPPLIPGVPPASSSFSSHHQP